MSVVVCGEESENLTDTRYMKDDVHSFDRAVGDSCVLFSFLAPAVALPTNPYLRHF